MPSNIYHMQSQPSKVLAYCRTDRVWTSGSELTGHTHLYTVQVASSHPYLPAKIVDMVACSALSNCFLSNLPSSLTPKWNLHVLSPSLDDWLRALIYKRGILWPFPLQAKPCFGCMWFYCQWSSMVYEQDGHDLWHLCFWTYFPQSTHSQLSTMFQEMSGLQDLALNCYAMHFSQVFVFP
jgi:hypothetical protein